MPVATPTLLMIGSLALSAYSLSEAADARDEQRQAMKNQADIERQSRDEQRAGNAAQAANERRAQIREERVRRARIMQSAENTGSAGSSGELGALGALSTNLSSNIGTNLGAIQSANKISSLNQQAADFGTLGQMAQLKGQDAQAMYGLGTSMFQSAGGFTGLMSLGKTK